MSIKIAINGFGRIGRCITRAVFETDNKDIELVAINGPAPIETQIHLLKYDSIHGKFSKEVKADGNNIVIDGKKIPLFGERDLANGTIEIARRDTLTKETVSIEGIDALVEKLLADIQSNLYNKAVARNKELTTTVNSYEEFKKVLDEKTGFVYAHWDGTPETEEKIKEETKATIRCIPLNNVQEAGVCIYSGKPSTQRVLFARAY